MVRATWRRFATSRKYENDHSRPHQNLDLNILDNGTGVDAGTAVSHFPARPLTWSRPSKQLAWCPLSSLIPAVALKTPLILKPGGSEPWTLFRIVQALIQAGCPREALAYYPADHAGEPRYSDNAGAE
jgi:acyl-CoA reductase-like NAD-dependent aldehyde dehydrogenase